MLNRKMSPINNLQQAPEAIREQLQGFKVYAKDASDDEPAKLFVTDAIGKDWFGDGVSAADVKKFLSDNKGRSVSVEINSPGGLAHDGLSIYNDLTRHDGSVDVLITGLAFSAASVIAMAGDTIRMHEAADFGIHRSSVVAWGNSRILAAAIEWLDALDEHLIEIYEARTGAGRKKIESWLDGTDDGTLWGAKDAVALGFADEVIPTKKREKDSVSNQINSASRLLACKHRLREMRTRCR